MIIGVWGGIISSTITVSRSLVPLLVGMFVSYIVDNGCIHVIKRMVGRVTHEDDASVLLITTMIVLAAARWARVVKDWNGISKFRIGRSIYKPSINTINSERHLV